MMTHHSKIDPKNLRPFKPHEMRVGGTFYLKNQDGSFSRCKVTKDEMKHRVDNYLMTLKYAEQGKVFINRNRPWQSFE